MALSRSTKRRLTAFGMLLVVIVVWVVYLFPVVWLLMMSVKTQVDIFRGTYTSFEILPDR